MRKERQVVTQHTRIVKLKRRRWSWRTVALAVFWTSSSTWDLGFVTGAWFFGKPLCGSGAGSEVASCCATGAWVGANEGRSCRTVIGGWRQHCSVLARHVHNYSYTVRNPIINQEQSLVMLI